MNRPLLGCIADDFTGATDLANTLVRNGMRTVQTIGVPASAVEADAIVVALVILLLTVGNAVVSLRLADLLIRALEGWMAL